MDDANELTPQGQELAKLPLDPRVGRMILEARARGALAEVLVIASALSVQDVRDRPLEAQAQADQVHAKFDDEKSEFSGYVRLWNWLDDARGGKVVASSRREMAAQHSVAAKARNQAFLPVAQRGSGAQPSPQPSPSGEGVKTTALGVLSLSRLRERAGVRVHPTPTSSATASGSNCYARTTSTFAACASGATSIRSC